MMWLHCTECDHIFEDGELKIVNETLTEIDGNPYVEAYGVCPVCGGQVEEAGYCEICGGSFDPESLIEGVCQECLAEAMTEEIMMEYVMSDIADFAAWLAAREDGADDDD